MSGPLVDPSIAINSYNTTRSIGNNVQSDTSTNKAGGPSFAEYLKDSVEESIDTLRTSEEMSAKAVTGEADVTEVVQAVTNAELTLQTVVSIRDRMVSAYQEILRMPI